MRIIIIVLFILCGAGAFAATIEGKELADSIEMNNKKLVLNGVGLRTKKKFGMNFKVYVAGLYVGVKSAEADKLLAPGDKVLELIFLRSLDKDSLQEAWSEAFPANCRVKCDSEAELIKKYNELMVDVKEGDRLKITFDKDGVSVDLKGKKESKSGRIDGAAFAENLLAVFIGNKPPTEELKKGLLGGK